MNCGNNWDIIKTVLLSVVCAGMGQQKKVQPKEKKKMKSPLYKDPIFDGAADPVIIWNHIEKCWWMFYTNRCVQMPCDGVEWVHGTDIGIASSKDMVNWVYRGIAEGLNYERGRNTYWAPEVIFADGCFHMYITYVSGVPSDWNHPRCILHYTSTNLWDWSFAGKLALSSDKCIDACVHRLPGGNWGLWYKDEKAGSCTWRAESRDLYHWENPKPVITGFPHEGPNVFYWKNRYFMIVDTWHGQGVFSSEDCENWVRRKDILTESGKEKDDFGCGLHADVMVQGEEAWILYFTHPGRREGETDQYQLRRSAVQMRKLDFDGENIICDRNRLEDFKAEE